MMPLLSAALFFLVSKSVSKELTKPIFYSASALYLLGMFRHDGVDVANYRREYENTSEIVDVGFNALMLASKFVGLPFELFLFSIGIANVYLISEICKAMGINRAIVMVLFLSHLAVVRDFSQLRIGLAVNLITWSIFCNTGLLRVLAMISGLSIHITSIVLLYGILSYKIFDRYRSILLGICLVSVFAILALYIDRLVNFDPRIELYLNNDKVDYGTHVTKYGQVIFIFMLASSSLLLQLNNELKLQLEKVDMLIFFCFMGLVIFFSFQNYAVFSHRLTNVALSLYPFLLASKLDPHARSPIIIKFIVISFLLAAFEMRHNKYEIIEKIELGFL